MTRTIASILLLCAVSDVSAQCSTTSAVPPHPFHDPPVWRDRGGPAPFVLPVIVHVYYNDVLGPIGVTQIPPILELANLDLRGMNADTADACSLFAPLVGDLGIELRLATIDEDGNCTSGILHHWYDHTQGITPDHASFAQNTAEYLNIHIFPAMNSYAVIPSTGFPVPGDPQDGIVLSYYDATARPRMLAHEVGHWVGLYHTFGATNTSGVNCGDDGLADTPETKGSVVNTCDTTLSECAMGVIENVDNFMDYSDCGKMFTVDQMAHVNAVMTDPLVPRAQHCTPANHAATGIYLTPTCPLEAQIHQMQTVGCDAVTVDFSATSTGQVPDQLEWSFPGGSPSSSNDASPTVAYLTSGVYTAQLIACNTGGCDTTQLVFNVALNAPTNGLLPITALPFTEDFEGGFSLPDTHVNALPSGNATWQTCDLAGYASSHCMYMPPEVQSGDEDNDLIVGNFDLTGITQPTLSFKVATSSPPFTAWSCDLHILFRDLCDNTLPVGPWSFTYFYIMAGSNTTAGFVPSSDSQWVPLTFTFPQWSLYGMGELTIRAHRQWLPLPFVQEPLYLDDINLGPLDISTPAGEVIVLPSFDVRPNPASDAITFTSLDPSGMALQILDVTGRTMLSSFVPRDRTIDVSTWPRGCYLAVVDDTMGRSTRRFVLE